MKAPKDNTLTQQPALSGAGWPGVDQATAKEPAWATKARLDAEKLADGPTPWPSSTQEQSNAQPSAPKAKRDAHGRLLPGSSGNLRGRPIKERRAFSTRQMWRDFAKESARPVVVNGEKMSSFEVVWRRLYAAAMAGDMQAIKLLLTKAERIVSALEAMDLKSHRDLGMAEQLASSHPDDRLFYEALNRLRAQSFDF